ncbi:UDP-glucose 4-epimerase, partial [bacterium K02(2017)]
HIVRKNIKDDVEIVTETSDDNRSYHISSQKIKDELGFAPKYTIDDAVNELVNAFDAGNIEDSMNNPDYYNIKKMQQIDLQ